MDPATITSIAGLVIKTLELVHKRREGNLQKDEAQALYTRIYASLLFEIGQNLDRCKNMVTKAEKGVISAGVLSFFVRDALFPDFCIMCPEPQVVAKVNELYAALERIHHWQRIISSLKDEGVNYVIGFAKALFDRGLHETYNELVVLSEDIAVPTKIEAPNKTV